MDKFDEVYYILEFVDNQCYAVDFEVVELENLGKDHNYNNVIKYIQDNYPGKNVYPHRESIAAYQLIINNNCMNMVKAMKMKNKFDDILHDRKIMTLDDWKVIEGR